MQQENRHNFLQFHTPNTIGEEHGSQMRSWNRNEGLPMAHHQARLASCHMGRLLVSGQRKNTSKEPYL